MSKLEFYCRPLVAFDPSNKKHRRYYYDFLKYGGWGRCPVRFACPDETGFDLTVMIRNQLIDFYVNREFQSVAKLQHQEESTKKKVVQNRKKRLTDEMNGTIIRHTER